LLWQQGCHHVLTHANKPNPRSTPINHHNTNPDQCMMHVRLHLCNHRRLERHCGHTQLLDGVSKHILGLALECQDNPIHCCMPETCKMFALVLPPH
jgi:hypothetical protein